MTYDVVIPYSGASKKGDDFELKHALRSLEAQPWIGRVFIVGVKPVWAVGVEHVEADDGSKAKDVNMIAKFLAACAVGISERFVITSDDQYFLKPASDFGPWLENVTRESEVARRYDQNTWCRRAMDTLKWCEEHGYPRTMFQSHVPYLVERDRYVELMGSAPWSSGNGLTTHVYLNMTVTPPVPDEPAGMVARVLRPRNRTTIERLASDATFLNHNDPGLNNELRAWLTLRFPEPSRWEA